MRTTGRRAVAAATGMVVGLGVWAACGISASAETGDAFGSYVLRASASGYRLLLAGGQVDGTIPDASSSFETGGLGYSRASIAWPGALAGNAGDLIVVLGAGQVPKDAEPVVRQGNDPVRAEARSPSGPAKASYDQVPGTVLRATADAAGATAQGAVQRSAAPGAADIGGSTASTATRIEDKAVRSEATSAVTDINLAGVIHIDSIVTTARATSDGVKGTGTATTRVDGVTVAGQPATIDETGLHLGGSSKPLNDTVNQIAEQALAQANIKVVVSKPVTTSDGPSATSGAGAVLFSIGNNDVGVIFGGASASAAAVPAFIGGTASAGDVGSGTPVGGAQIGASVGSSTPSLGGGDGNGGRTPAPLAPAAQGRAPALDAELVANLGEANPLWLALVGGFLGCLFAGALRRLGTGILELGPACDEGEAS